ncbi:MAG: hypothetical protein PXX77_06075 [Gallionella sp.]|nr:hypothetical protein [Gallionella sp.]
MRKATVQIHTWNDSSSILELLMHKGFDATLSFLCTLFVFSDD